MRFNNSNFFLNSTKLFQQFLIDAYSMIESSRLNFIRNNQDQLRVDMYKGIHEVILRGDNDTSSTGMHITLPTSFTGDPRYMFNNFIDALQIYYWTSFSFLCITITCNLK